MRHKKIRHGLFCMARGASILVSLVGIVAFVGADSIPGNLIFTLQILGGVAMVGAGLGFYNAWRYMELWILERERQLRKEKRARDRQVSLGA